MRDLLLKITLLSDMCVSDGSIYNSYIDTDCCYDRNGFPYIPAKRIRGCLRENALELAAWGINVNPDLLFGKEDRDVAGGSSKVRISDAVLSESEDFKNNEAHKGAALFHPQNILDAFSYVRTQTALNYQTGVADETSLRTIRVVNKGLVFEAKVQVEDEYKDALSACVGLLAHMGLARTRGLGEVKAELIDGPVSGEQSEKNTPTATKYHDGDDTLLYSIHLEEPVICKSAGAEESESMDYIEGSKIMGLLLGRKITYSFFEDDSVRFSNAYISKDGMRLHEVGMNLSSIKNNEKEYYDEFYPRGLNEESEQLSKMKHCYVAETNGGLMKVIVAKENRYHHRRDDDKGIGRAGNNNDASHFYQMSAIEAGQTFKGYITGPTKMIKLVAEELASDENCIIGYSRSSEYGKCTITVDECRCSAHSDKVEAKTLCLRLTAPAIFYNDRAFASADPVDFIEEALVGLGLEANQVLCVKPFVAYTTIGGFNVTWRKPKPTQEVFDQGSVLLITCNESVTVPTSGFIGERCREGYGEFAVEVVDDTRKVGEGRRSLLSQTISASGESVDVEKNPLAKKLCDVYFDKYLVSVAVDMVPEIISDDEKISDKKKSTISNMILICSETSTIDGVKAAVKSRFEDKKTKKSKAEEANKIIEVVTKEERINQLTEGFCKAFKVENYQPENVDFKLLKACLTQLKYCIHRRRNQEEVSGNE